MFDHLIRVYKDDPAEETIHRIRTILKNLGLLPIEMDWQNPYNEIYSVWIYLDETHGMGGTSGKGRSIPYALASAYGEFMERIQSMPIDQFSSKMFLEQIHNRHGFMHFPDEKIIRVEEFEETAQKIIHDNFENDKTGAADFRNLASMYKVSMNYPANSTAEPFYDTKNNTIIHIPSRFIHNHCVSNGVCAGNTPEEALCQGLCEIMERHAVKVVYYNRLTPPTIPVDYLKLYPDEYAIIEEIEENGRFEVIVKDFSAKMDYPVLGVMIKDLHQDTYRLSFGSDYAFPVALSRALTEYFQIGGSIPQGTPIPHVEYSFFLNDDEESLLLRSQNFFRQFRGGSPSLFPKSLFDKNQDYPFDPGLFIPEKNYKLELKKIVKFFHEKGKNVYIRNNSFLHFPGFHIFIPSISWPFNDVFSMYLYWDKEELPDLKKAFKEDNTKLLTPMARKMEAINWTKNLLEDVFHLKFRVKSQMKNLFDIPFLLCCIWYRLEDFNSCKEQINKYVKDEIKQTPFNLAAREYINMKTEGMSTETIIKNLENKGFSAKSIREVSEIFNEPRNVLLNYKFPDCPFCERCKLASECVTKNSLKTIEKVYPAMKKAVPDQMNLSSLIR
jgi:ribosomal protein S12 methylthiotransferase accessory factor